MKHAIIQIIIQALVIWSIQWYTSKVYFEKGFVRGYEYGVQAYERTCKRILNE